MVIDTRPISSPMLPRCSVFVATSLDGFIAREDGRLDWLDAANSAVPPGEDCGYGAFIATVDTLVMGRATMEKVLTFGGWPYGELPVIVLSRHGLALPYTLSETVSVSAESPPELVRRLAGQGKRHLYIDGGRVIQSFLEAGLIDELTITRIPVLLGAGRPLFGPTTHDIPLVHVATRVFDFGYVQHTYRVARQV